MHGLAVPHRYKVIKTDNFDRAMEELRLAYDVLDTTHGRPGVAKLERARDLLMAEGDPSPTYFVLRLDPDGDDPIWTSSCRNAILTLISDLDAHQHLPQLAEDLEELLEKLEAEVVKRRVRP